MVLQYTPEPRPSQLLRDLLCTYWDNRNANIPRPIIIEKPSPDYQRADIRNEGNHVIVSVEGVQERPLTIAFQHRDITIDMLVEVKVFTSRQRLYDYVNEIRRVIHSKRFEPDDFLLDGFEDYTNTAALNDTWADTTGFSTLSLTSSSLQFGDNSMKVIVSGGVGEAYRALPNTTILVPRPFPDRLQQVRFYAKVDSGSPVIGMTLRDASNRAGLFRTWNVTISETSYASYTVDITNTADSSAGTWDPSLIDELAFTSIDDGRILDIDHIELGTDEFQFLQYYSYEEHVENFDFFEADIRASFRSAGEAVPVLT